MTRFTITLPAICMLAIFGCSDKGTEPSKPFSLSIAVEDPQGHPRPGVRVSCANLLSSPLADVSKRLTGKLKSAIGTTSIEFASPRRFRGTAEILTLEGARVAVAAFPEILGAGMYAWGWRSGDSVHDGAYMCRFVARDDTSDIILFADSMYMVQASHDPSRTILGWTSLEGVVGTSDRTRFPFLYALPPMILTSSESPDSIGTFSYTDSLEVILTDTAAQRSVRYVRHIIDGPNKLTLTWNTGLTQPPTTASAPPKWTTSIEMPDTVEPFPIPKNWKLYQNFPNPYY